MNPFLRTVIRSPFRPTAVGAAMADGKWQMADEAGAGMAGWQIPNRKWQMVDEVDAGLARWEMANGSDAGRAEWQSVEGGRV